MIGYNNNNEVHITGAREDVANTLKDGKAFMAFVIAEDGSLHCAANMSEELIEKVARSVFMSENVTYFFEAVIDRIGNVPYEQI